MHGGGSFEHALVQSYLALQQGHTNQNGLVAHYIYHLTVVKQDAKIVAKYIRQI